MRVAYNYYELKKRLSLSRLKITKLHKVYSSEDYGYLLETDNDVDLGFIDLSISENLVTLNTRAISKETRNILDALGVTLFTLEEHVLDDFDYINLKAIEETSLYSVLTLPSDLDKEGDVYHKTSGYKVGTYYPSKYFKSGYIKFFPNKEDVLFLTNLAESRLFLNNKTVEGTYWF